MVSIVLKRCNCCHFMFVASPYSSISAKDAITCNGLGAFRFVSARRVVNAALYSLDMARFSGRLIPRRLLPRGLCGVWFCACPHAMYLRTVPNRFHFLTAEGRCEIVGHALDPIKLHKPTMQKMMAISNVINAREPTAFMIEEA